MEIGFLANGGGQVGLGHISRCTAIAIALSAIGHECRLVTTHSGAEFAASEFPGSIVGARGEDLLDASLLHDSLGSSRWIVIDHYGVDRALMRACRKFTSAVLLIEDDLDRRHDADIVVYPSPQNDALDRLTSRPNKSRLIGADFMPLRPQLRREAALNQHARRSVSALHIGFGGTSAGTWVNAAIAASRQTYPDADISVVLATEEQAALVKTTTKTRVHIKPPNPLSLLAKSDIAVGASGVSAWERAALGIPSVICTIADNQRPVASALSRAGAAMVAKNPSQIAGHLASLHNRDIRQAMKAQAQLLCDGRGAQRIALEMFPEVAGDGATVTIRRATDLDAQLMFDWQSLPETRRFSRNPSNPSWQEHVGWFSATLKNPNAYLSVIEHRGEACGVLRTDSLDGARREISIFLAPSAKAKGIASAALRTARRLFPEITLDAEVHPENTASIALFEACGYKRISSSTFRHDPQ